MALPISSTSSPAEITASYRDNAPPFRSVAQCEEFIRACVYKIDQAAESGSASAHYRFQLDLYSKKQQEAQEWLDAHGGGSVVIPQSQVVAAPRVTYVDFRNSRD